MKKQNRLITKDDLLEIALCAYRCCDNEEDLEKYIKAVFKDLEKA